MRRFDVPHWTRLWRCDRCQLYQYGKAADAQAYSAAYHAGYQKHRQKKLRTANIRLSAVASIIDIAQPRLLDVGCSVGCTVEAAARRGWKAVGVDLSHDAVQACRARGLDCHTTGPLHLPFEDHSFDVLVAWHVIEHVEDVRATLSEWKRVVRPNGLIVLETPDANCGKARLLKEKYRKFWAPEHTYTFTAENLSRFFEQAGFDVLPPSVWRGLTHLPLPMSTYACGYHTFHVMRKLFGISKAFQLLARPRQPASAAETPAAA